MKNEYPIYLKHSAGGINQGNYVKIISEIHSLYVCDGTKNEALIEFELDMIDSYFGNKAFKQSNEKEFKEAYNKALEELNKLV